MCYPSYEFALAAQRDVRRDGQQFLFLFLLLLALKTIPLLLLDTFLLLAFHLFEAETVSTKVLHTSAT